MHDEPYGVGAWQNFFVAILFCSDKPWQGLEDLLLFVFMGLWWEDVDFEATLNHGYIRPTLFNMYYFVVGSSTDH